MKPTIGRIVHFKIDDWRVRPMIVTAVWPGEYGPDSYGINGTVFLDGSNDLRLHPIPEVIGTHHGCKPVAPDVPLLHIYSAKQGDGPGEWNWPPRE